MLQCNRVPGRFLGFDSVERVETDDDADKSGTISNGRPEIAAKKKKPLRKTALSAASSQCPKRRRRRRPVSHPAPSHAAPTLFLFLPFSSSSSSVLFFVRLPHL